MQRSGKKDRGYKRRSSRKDPKTYKYFSNAHKWIRDRLDSEGRGAREKFAETLEKDPSAFGSIINEVDGDGASELTISQYLLIADYYEVSLDEIFGRKNFERWEPEPSPRDCCKMLLSIYKTFGFRFGKTTKIENCYAPAKEGSYKFEKRENVYTTMIFFPEQLDNIDDYSKIPKPLRDENLSARAYINDFIEQLSDAVKYSGEIKNPEYSAKMFDLAIDNALSSVPDSEELEDIIDEKEEEHKTPHDRMMQAASKGKLIAAEDGSPINVDVISDDD